jgi:hypothetical protein
MMPPFGPIKRSALIRALRAADFAGPYPGKKHQIMIRSGLRVRVPNPHQRDVGRELLALILHEAGITRDEWEKL